MNKFLAVLLMLMGIFELVIAFTNKPMPLPVSLIMGALFIGMGMKNLWDACRNRSKS